jgi:hypothetical protein
LFSHPRALSASLEGHFINANVATPTVDAVSNFFRIHPQIQGKFGNFSPVQISYDSYPDVAISEH